MKKTITRTLWDQMHDNFKGYIKGKPVILQLDETTGATVMTPVKIRPNNKGKHYIYPKI